VNSLQIGRGSCAGLFAAPAILRADSPVVIRAGALKLIHSIAPYFYDQFLPAGYKVEVLPFETRPNARTRSSPSRSISRVRHRRRDPGAAAGEPVW